MDRSLHRLGSKLALAAKHTSAPRQTRAGRKLNLSPRRRAQLKLQGQYIGYMRNLKPKQKAEVKRLREKKGMEMAMRRARSLMKKEMAA